MVNQKKRKKISYEKRTSSTSRLSLSANCFEKKVLLELIDNFEISVSFFAQN